MFTTKSIVAMFAIAAGGFLNAGNEHAPASGGVAATAWQVPVASSVPLAAAGKDETAWQLSASNALATQLKIDLRDPTARLRLNSLSFTRVDGRPVQATGTGYIRFDGAHELQVEVDVTYESSSPRVEHSVYRLLEAAPRAAGAGLGDATRAAVADRIGSRLVLEFAHQPVDFSLLAMTELASGKQRVLLSGNGVTSFHGEGEVFTNFVATVDKATGKILTVQYELLQEIPTVNEAFATAN